MGENAELILDGTLCQVCGELMEDLIPEEGNILKTPPGHPRSCYDCKGTKRRRCTNKKAPKTRVQPEGAYKNNPYIF